MEWFQYTLPTYAERWLTSFLCCGQAYGAIFCPLPLPPLELSQIWEVFWNYGSMLGCKWWRHCTVAEVLTQHWMVPTSHPNICKVDGNLHMMWMGIDEVIIRRFQLRVWAKIWEVLWNSGSLLGCKWHHCAVAEVLTHHGMVPTSPPNIWEVLEKLHMLWMGIWVHHKAISTMCVGCRPRIGKSSEIVHCWVCSLQMTPFYSGWGSNPTWNGFHIPSQHMNRLWQASYAVDRHMKP